MQSVLLVRPNSAAVDTIRQAIESVGFRTQWVSTTEDAIQKIKTSRLSMIIIELGASEIDAMSVTRIVRDNHRTRNTHITIVGSATDGDAVAETLSHGANDYLSKPVGKNEILSRVAWVMRRGEAFA